MGSRPDRDRERPSDLSGRFLGALLGLAVGDALGTTVEFQTPGRFEPVVDMVGGGPFRLAPGQWTDDTSMALCLAESLIEDGFQPESQMKRYLRWYREGYLSSTGRCFDIGVTVREALEAFESAGNPVAGSTDPRKAGNGSLMRLAPLPLFLYQDPATAIHLAGESSRVTHGATTAVDACRFFSGLLIGALKGYGKEDLLAPVFSPIDGYYQAHPLCAEIATIAQGSFKRKQPPEIRGTGYVVESLEAALWAFDRAESFEDTVLLAVNLGHDADTTAAIAGQLAGAYYGVEAIPSRWRDRLAMREVIERLAWDLYRRGLEDHDLAFWGQNTEREPD
ncbi:ADP-ribosylglycohydrolase family protein [bacterium]|nr:ADP-ribosylglycohydrolase family protein [bacterium]